MPIRSSHSFLHSSSECVNRETTWCPSLMQNIEGRRSSDLSPSICKERPVHHVLEPLLPILLSRKYTSLGLNSSSLTTQDLPVSKDLLQSHHQVQAACAQGCKLSNQLWPKLFARPGVMVILHISFRCGENLTGLTVCMQHCLQECLCKTLQMQHVTCPSVVGMCNAAPCLGRMCIEAAAAGKVPRN